MSITYSDYSIHDGKPGKAESDRFAWSSMQDGYLRDKLSNKTIYQMCYLRTTGFGSDPVDEEIKVIARAFWDALRAEQVRAATAHAVEREAELDAEESERKYPRDEAKAREYDNLHNEGDSDGYNPYR